MLGDILVTSLIILLVLVLLSPIILTIVGDTKWYRQRKSKKELVKLSIVLKKKSSLVDKHYTREDRLIEAHELIKYHGAWTYKTATEAIDRRMDLIRQTLASPDSWKFNCPVCQRLNYGYKHSGITVNCECPAREKIKQIYRESRNGEA